MHKLPIFYFSIRRDEIIPEQLKRLLSFEKAVGDVKCETGIPGLKIDFNAGVRVQVPAGNWHIRISDYDTGMIGFDMDISEQVIISAEKYYIHWMVEAFLNGEKVFEHVINLNDKKIYIYMPNGILGDTVAVLPYVCKLKQQYNAEVYLYPPDMFKDICQEYMPDIALKKEIPEDCYASFCLAVFEHPPYLMPDDSRHWPLYMSAGLVLGLHEVASEIRYYPTAERNISEPYVCIAVQASGIMKRWLYPNGWNMVVAALKEMGYRVLCIDAEPYYKEGSYEVKIPDGAEDFTGKIPLMERINLLAYAEFFIGLGSGLSWLANACNIPVILISGFSLPIAEFETPYRIYNQLVCHGCYNDLKVNWKDGCPYHAGTNREYECSKMISPLQVIEAVCRLLKNKNLDV